MSGARVVEELRATFNGVSVWVGQTRDGATAVVSVHGTGLEDWTSSDPDTVALCRSFIAGECQPEVLADHIEERPHERFGLPTCGDRATSLLRMHVTPVRIHVRTWSGSGSGAVVEMANAGRRGKWCRVVRFMGSVNNGPPDTEPGRVSEFTRATVRWLNSVSLYADFDEVAAELRRRVAEAAVPAAYGNFLDEGEVRGVDAPKVKLVAGVPGEWSAGADEEGVSLHDLADVNEWTEVTHGQSSAEAYRLAAKVWDKVRAAKTRKEASDILSAAGCKLHGFCGLD